MAYNISRNLVSVVLNVEPLKSNGKKNTHSTFCHLKVSSLFISHVVIVVDNNKISVCKMKKVT